MTGEPTDDREPTRDEGDRMSRLVWVGIGAVGGIYAYRRGQRVWEQTKERGVAGNTAAITRTATAVYRGIRAAEQDDVVDLTGEATTARVIDAEPAQPVMVQTPADEPAPNRSGSGAGTRAGTAAVRLINTYRRTAR